MDKKTELCSKLDMDFDEVKDQELFELASRELCSLIEAKININEDDLIDLQKLESIIQKCRQI